MTVTLAQVVAQTESNDNQEAVRFEHDTYTSYKSVDDHRNDPRGHQILTMERIMKCSPDTARMLLSTSFGAYQFMGFNIIPQNIFDFLASRDVQDKSFIEFAQHVGVSTEQMADASWLLTDKFGHTFATRYNGPGAPVQYLARLQESYQLLLKQGK